MVQVAVRNARVGHESIQLGSIRPCSASTVNIGLGHNLNQWRTRAVQINQAVVTIMCQLACVLFHMRVMDAHANTLAIIKRRVNVSRKNNRLIHLAGLVSLGKIWVEIMLAIKTANMCDIGVQRLARLDG